MARATDNSHEHVTRWTAFGQELHRRLGSGVELDPHVRGRFQDQLGADLTGAVVHRSPLAGLVARAIGAQALTAERHIAGSEADLDSATPAGAALLGHELTHVVRRDATAAGELHAQAVEREISSVPAPAAAEPTTAGDVDVDALTECVYRRMVDELLRERDRAAWVV
jgi:hypothetical protein